MMEQRFADLFASGSQVPLEIAEREITLTYVLKLFQESETLQDLAFKGGTALRKCIYGKETRFSLDLDFTRTGKEIDPEDLILRLVGILTQPAYGIHFNVETKDFYVSDDRSSCGAVIGYRHDWHQAIFKLEISLREKPSLPLVSMPLKPQAYFKHLEFSAFSVPCLQFEEMLAEKIRAASQRVRARDLYDLARAAEKPFNVNLIRSLAVIKCWNVRDPFDPQKFFERIQSSKYDWDDLKQLLRRSEKLDTKRMIASCRKRYQFLENLTQDEIDIIADAKRHRLKETAVAKRLLNHPRVQ